jgi:hypothetical protein
MTTSLMLITILSYLLALSLLWRDRSLRYLLILFAGHVLMLLVPLWQQVYQVTPIEGPGPSLFGRFTIPWSLLIGGGPVVALPSLIFYYGLRHRWWPRHYLAIWVSYIAFVMYFLFIEAVLVRNGALLFAGGVLVGETAIPAEIIQAVLLGGVSLGMAYTLVSTRHYALQVALVPLLLSGIVAALLFLGIFASPLWVTGLLEQEGWIVIGGALVSLGLVLWGVHLLASGLHAGRRQQFMWR